MNNTKLKIQELKVERNFLKVFKIYRNSRNKEFLKWPRKTIDNVIIK